MHKSLNIYNINNTGINVHVYYTINEKQTIYLTQICIPNHVSHKQTNETHSV